MNPSTAKRLRLLARVLGGVLLLVGLAGGWFFWRLRGSLPQLDGTAPVAGLGAEVRIERDALGVPTIRAATRIDAARALGFLHAQDRFFQMDIMRRSAAGELAEMFGKRALPRDQAARRHGFRALAEQVVAQLPPADRALLDAYVVGVNSGLGALGQQPFEYLIVRGSPRAWNAADSVLIIYAMTLDLQDGANRYEQAMMTLREQLGPEALAFFNPLVLPNDAALDGTTAPLPPIPGPQVLDLRAKRVGLDARAREGGRSFRNTTTNGREHFPFLPRDPEAIIGSNAFALSGSHTANGVAMLANDMHLDHMVPNTWYRAVLEWSDARGGVPRPQTTDSRSSTPTSPGEASAGGAISRVVGVTLPGTPAVVVGSNGRVAWGFTSSQVDTTDLVIVETQPSSTERYVAPGQREPLAIEHRRETIRVKGEPDEVVDYPRTIWGPIVGTNSRGQPLALRWTAHDLTATNFNLMAMESAQTVTDAIQVAHRAGMPAQNLVVADFAGDVAWTIAGKLPKRVGFDGRVPVSWASGERTWEGYLPTEEVPVFATKAPTTPAMNPLPDGRIWSANQRHVGGPALAKLGDNDYSRPERAAQIRDDLAKLERATERDLLAVQLDDRALFLAPWHTLLMKTLTPEAIAQRPARAALRDFAQTWEGRASVEAVSYRLVREFRLEVYAHVFPPIFERCESAMPLFPWDDFQLEPALWAMLRAQPMHLLAPHYASWDELLLASVDDLIKELDREGVKLPQANWGWQNRARIRHPFGNLLPAWMSGWLNMPVDPLPGGDDMPRAQTSTHGASERLVVSPGREHEGIFHMPGGQSAHPLSPYFRAGHGAWVRGEATPLLPGKAEHVLRLTP